MGDLKKKIVSIMHRHSQNTHTHTHTYAYTRIHTHKRTHSHTFCCVIMHVETCRSCIPTDLLTD